jgi:hypothetical protein
MQITKTTNIIAQMKYVVQCYISDMKGQVVKIQDYKSEADFWALEYAYTKACEFYNDVLPVPDNGRYEDYTN